jgi:hypothetical protein
MREKIISEIKRIAGTNGGQPPGRVTFENETGIRPQDWRGKHWARWGDALIDAGFQANELQQKLDLESVFPKVALAVRQFAREPTTAELEMLRHQDPTFPAYKSVINHFESKSQMMQALKKWAETSEAYSDIVAILPDYTVIKTAAPTKGTKEGHVYLIKSGEFYKIGRGDELEKRVKQIRTALPDASSLEHSIRTDDPSGIEAYWHRRFADKRANGEWFKLTTHDVIAFKKRKFQ